MVGTARSIEITKVSYQVQSTDACLCYQSSLHDNPHKPGHRPPTQSEINVTFRMAVVIYMTYFLSIQVGDVRTLSPRKTQHGQV